MDEAFVFTVVCVGPIFLLGAFTALIVWLVRKSSADARLRTLESEVAYLRHAIDHLSRQAPQPKPIAALYTAIQQDKGSEPSSVIHEAIAASAAEAVAPAPPQPPPPAIQPPARPPAPAAPSPPPDTGGWERWIGVRGAAALGAAVLVLASLYFFRYSIEHNLISPTVRVILGTLLGLTCIVSAETVLRARQPALSHWLAGAGFAILYLAFWAAGPLYGLVSNPVTWVLMILVTAATCVLSVKRHSVPVAVLGLLGGFATPLLLSTGQDRPVALFAYLLLLDAALLLVAHRRRWPWLGLLALAGTTAYQGLWIMGRMGSELDRVLLGMGIVVVFSAAFAIAGSLRRRAAATATDATPADEGPTLLDWITRVSSALFPFFFALYFGAIASVENLWPTAALLTLLVAGAAYVARRDAAPWIGLSAVCAALGVLASWLLVHRVEGAVTWEVVAFTAAIALVTHLATELDRNQRWETMLAAGATLLGGLVLSTFAVGSTASVAGLPWLLLFAFLAALGIRQASLPDRAPLHLAVALFFAVALATLDITHVGQLGMPAPPAMIALSVAAAVAYALAALTSRRPELRKWASHGAALVAAILLLHIGVLAPTIAVPTLHLVAAAVLLAVLIALAAIRSAPGPWLMVSAACGAIVLAMLGSALPSSILQGDRIVVFAAHGVLALLLAALPFALPARLRELAWTWRGAALAPVFLFPYAAHLYEGIFGHDGIAVVPLALATLGVVSAALLQRFGPTDFDARRSATAWLGGVAIALITIAIPLELENEWLTIAWAVQAFALLLLWRRLDHAGLKWIALALVATVTIRLCFNPWVLDYSDRGPLPVLNWLAYTYLVPFAALIASWFVLRHEEVDRFRTREISFFGSHARGAQFLVVCAIAILFVWTNLAVFDVYSTGPSLEIPLDRLPARDLTLSIAWAVFGLGLLALGMWRQSTALRILSLGLILLTSAKVFLYDLAMLKDLYRVASLGGLAVSLILISLAYQRFVFSPRGSAARGPRFPFTGPDASVVPPRAE